jgi:hypothetical protein
MDNKFKKRLKHLEWQNRLQMIFILGLVVFLIYGSSPQGEENMIVRCERLEVVDGDGHLVAVLGIDADGSRGLFIHDQRDHLRLAAVQDPSQSAFYVFDTTGTVRIGVAQFAHGGGRVALHGENSKGAAVLYYKDGGSLIFYDTEGKITSRIPLNE